MFYIPVIFSNDTSIRTCTFFDKATGDYEFHFFRGILYVNETPIISTRMYGNISLVSIYTEDNSDNHPNNSTESYILNLIQIVKQKRRNDTETSFVMCSDPVGLKRDDIESYYWLVLIPNLYPGTITQYQLYGFPSDGQGTPFEEYCPYLYYSNVNDTQGISFASIGNASYVFITFQSVLIGT